MSGGIHVPGEVEVLHRRPLFTPGLSLSIEYCDRGAIEPSLAIVVRRDDGRTAGGAVISARFAPILAEASERANTRSLGEIAARIPIRGRAGAPGPELVVSVEIVRRRPAVILQLEHADGERSAATVLREDADLAALDRAVDRLLAWRRP